MALILDNAPAARSRFWKAVFIPKARGKMVPNEKTSNEVLKLLTTKLGKSGNIVKISGTLD